MNAKIRRMIDLRSIYTKERVRSGKILAQFPTKPSTVGSASCRRTWGTACRKNLMETSLKCQSTRSMPWEVKKASSQTKVRCDELRAIMVISKSSFIPKEPERRISKGYCRGIGPGNSLSMYILGLRRKPRTRGRPRRSTHYQGSLC